jgi:hypothetical protein
VLNGDQGRGLRIIYYDFTDIIDIDIAIKHGYHGVTIIKIITEGRMVYRYVVAVFIDKIRLPMLYPALIYEGICYNPTTITLRGKVPRVFYEALLSRKYNKAWNTYLKGVR